MPRVIDLTRSPPKTSSPAGTKASKKKASNKKAPPPQAAPAQKKNKKTSSPGVIDLTWSPPKTSSPAGTKASKKKASNKKAPPPQAAPAQKKNKKTSSPGSQLRWTKPDHTDYPFLAIAGVEHRAPLHATKEKVRAVIEHRMKSKMNKTMMQTASNPVPILGFKSGFGDLFSNFFEIPVTLDVSAAKKGLCRRVTFPSSEHAYQWASRVYPLTKDLSRVGEFACGGKYDGIPQEQRYVDGGPKSQPGKVKPGTWMKVREDATKQVRAIGISAKMAVGKHGPYNMFPRPFDNGISIEAAYNMFWQPILGAKFTQNDALLKALKLSKDRVLLEYSRGVMNPRMKGKRDTWAENVWAGKVDAGACKKGAGLNVMGVFLMRVRKKLVPSALGKNSWPH